MTKLSIHSQRIATSFVIVLSLLVALVLFESSRLDIMQEKIDAIVKEHNVKTQLMITMQHGIYDRQVSMRTLLLLDDVFERDEERLIFSSFAGKIIAARDQFAKMNLSYEEQDVLEEMNDRMVVAYNAQINLIEKALANEDEVITQAEIIAVFLTQDSFINQIRKMIGIQKTASNKAVKDAELSYREAKQLIYILGGAALLLGLFVATFIIRLTESQVRKVSDTMLILEKSNERLEERVNERTEELAQARDLALESNKAKDNFLANMSHELRTPLNIITGYSELLAEIAEEKKFKEIIPDLNKIQSAAKHQLQLINSILDITKIEAGKLDINIESIDLVSLLKDIDAATQTLMNKNSNKFSIECSEDIREIYSDRLRLHQILLNLLSNAAKFTSDGEVKLSISKDNNNIIFNVCDTGVGIPDDYLDKIFDKFSQEDSTTTRKYGGTGLGLSISKQLAILLKGDILVKSEKDIGSTFSLVLPDTIK